MVVAGVGTVGAPVFAAFFLTMPLLALGSPFAFLPIVVARVVEPPATPRITNEATRAFLGQVSRGRLGNGA